MMGIFLSAMIINNVILSQFLGLCPFLGVSRTMKSAAGMGAAVFIVIVLSYVITYPLGRIMTALEIEYLETIIYILVIATIVQITDIVIAGTMKTLYDALGVYLPLITTNCAVLGTVIKSTKTGYNFVEGLIFSMGISCGFILSILIMAGIREHIRVEWKRSLLLVTAGLMSLAFYGFAGMM